MGSRPLLDFLLPPMSFLVLLLLGLLLWRRPKASRAIILLATVLFTLAALPGVGGILSLPLIKAAPQFDPINEAAEGFDAILVPTGGNFADESGRWWPSQLSIERAVAGRELQKRLGLPLILAGGRPSGEEPAEAVTLAEALQLVGSEVRLETGPRNSAETAAAVAESLTSHSAPRVILVTSPTHVARMSAVLRHRGVSVAAYPAPASTLEAYTELARLGQWLPSSRGLSRSRRVLREYVGILWYLLRGEMRPGDLLPEP